MSVEDVRFKREQIDSRRIRATGMLLDLGEHLLGERQIDDMQLHVDIDAHGFFSYAGDAPEFTSVADRPIDALTLHVQAFPGLSSGSRAIVVARIMDTERLREIRYNGFRSVAVGEEHDAVTSNLYRGAQLEVAEYDGAILLDIVEEGIRDLNLDFPPDERA